MLARARAVASSLWVMGLGPAAPLYPREAGRELGVLLEGVDLVLWRREAPESGKRPFMDPDDLTPTQVQFLPGPDSDSVTRPATTSQLGHARAPGGAHPWHRVPKGQAARPLTG